MPPLILGADGGSTKTHFALADRGGRLVGFAEGGSSNHEWRGFGPVRAEFKTILARACREAGARPRDVVAACLGLSGCDIPADGPQILRHAVTPLGLGGPAAVFNDAFVPLFHDRYRDRGVTVTSGSWHKWLGMNGRRTFAHDGLHLAGLRERAGAELTRVAEGYQPPSAFTRALLRWLGFPTVTAYVERWVFGQEKRAFVPRVTPRQRLAYARIPVWLGRRAAAGDREAHRILDGYAADMAEGAAAVVRALGLGRAPFDVVLSGSILTGIPSLARATARRIRKALPRARIVVARERPIRGALHYAAHLAGWSLPAGALRDPRLVYPAATG